MMQRCWRGTLPLVRHSVLQVPRCAPVALAMRRTVVTENTRDDLDAFEQEYMLNRISISPFQRLLLGAGSSIASLLDPRR